MYRFPIVLDPEWLSPAAMAGQMFARREIRADRAGTGRSRRPGMDAARSKVKAGRKQARLNRRKRK